jgi:steroid 5-alpha reductase family enzyme
MKKADRTALVALPVVIALGCLVALAGSQGGAVVAGYPVFAVAVGLAFLIQWLAFIPAYLLQTEKFFDLTGSLTYMTVVLATIYFSGIDMRSVLLAVLVVVWAARLGSFLVRRIHKAGRDVRFNEIKPSFIRFLNAWTLQGLWVTFTASAALAAISSVYRKEMDLFAVIGFLIWLVGFAIEVAADTQKSRFSADPKNKGRFIQSGLWARSRHPNYFGEIVLWLGIALIAMPVLQGWQWVAMISPIFVMVLLTRVSGIPLLENQADEKWGGNSDYEAYKAATPVLIPKIFG